MDRSLATDERFADVFAFSPAGEADVRLALGLVVTFIVAALATLPWVHVRTPALDAVIMPTVGAFTLLAGFLAAGVCVSQFLVSRQPAILYLSLGAGIQSLFTVVWWFTEPRVSEIGTIVPAQLQAAPWLLMTRAFGFLLPLAMMAGCDIGVTSRFCRDRRTVAAFCGLMVAAALTAIAACYWATAALPPVVDGVRFTPFATRALTPIAAIAALGVFSLVLFGKRAHHAIDVWLSVALVAGLLGAILSAAGGARDSFGFYAGQLFGAASVAAILLQMTAKMCGLLLRLMRATPSRTRPR